MAEEVKEVKEGQEAPAEKSLVEKMIDGDEGSYNEFLTGIPKKEKKDDDQQQPTKGRPKKTVDSDQDFLKTHFPEFKSIDEIKEMKNRHQKLNEEAELSKKELEKTRADVERMKSAMKGLENGIDPKYIRMQKIEQENPSAADVYKEYLSGKMDLKKKIEAAKKIDDPILAENPEMLQIQMEDEFPVLFDSELEQDSPEYERAMTKVKHAALVADRKLKDYFDKIEIPAIETKEQRQQRFEKIFDSWKTFDFNDPEFTTVNVSLSKEDGSLESFMDIPIPDAEKPMYLKAALHYIIESGMDKNQDSVGKIKKYITGLWIGQNLEKYNRLIVEQRAKMTDKEWRRFIHNPGTFKQEVERGSGANTMEDFIDALPDAMI